MSGEVGVTSMTSDAAAVVVLILVFIYMVGVGVLLHAHDDVQPVIARFIAGVCAAVGFILLI